MLSEDFGAVSEIKSYFCQYPIETRQVNVKKKQELDFWNEVKDNEVELSQPKLLFWESTEFSFL